ncbi:glycosyltransferase [Rudanella paleaurantiibacter]|uniref:Glycosyltransferase n=1 Tax=Rudanella paleaurantiibacter TaxID=2614655 RepID=A0A7J5TZR8_9BACT|nr:glycosyltransferase [Rudanella paleaurantiibacter]KAB7729386.1 glycosyltransferase [Rudanella paleaurantiibacter]
MNSSNDILSSATTAPNTLPKGLRMNPDLTTSGARPATSAIPDDIDDLLCFSHLRWNFVYQRPQHLLTRAARRWRVWYVEEPIWSDTPGLRVRLAGHQLYVVEPHLPHGTTPDEAIRLQRAMVDQLRAEQRIQNYAVWYYTPMAMLFSDHLHPRLTVYDCMDELSAFMGAPPLLIEQEQRLMHRANLVFTGGYSLYEAKQKHHARAYPFPSCIDYDHFVQARAGLPNPADQQGIVGPRIGYSGVIDERLDLALIDQLVQRRPDWQFVFLGPVAKIQPDQLPKHPNLHFLGMKAYDDLPAYFSNWQAALMPFAINAATKYISPTKTPEYLAAGLPVLSTPVRDVVRSYGGWERVCIAESAEELGARLGSLTTRPADSDGPQLEQFLREQSWENTWQQMQRIMKAQLMVG